MAEPSEGLKLSRFNIWRLNKAANSNPIKDLLQNDGRKADLASDFASLFSALASGLAAAVAVYAAYYVVRRIGLFGDPSALGISKILANKILDKKELDTFFVCLPAPNSSLTVFLPPAQICSALTCSYKCEYGRYISISVPMPINTLTSTTDTRSVTVIAPAYTSIAGNQQDSKSYTVARATQVTFIVVNELQNSVWKFVRLHGQVLN